MRKLNAIIIDDEAKARMLLLTILENYCEDVSIVGFSDTIAESVYLIKNLKPEIVFIDIEMKGETGFDLFNKMEIPQNCFIVFVTAYKEYAIQALKLGAFDYVLKPIDIDEIVSVVNRVRSNISDHSTAETPQQTVSLTSKGEIHFINITEILYLQAEGRYTAVFTTDNRSFIQTKHLGAFEKELANHPFLRVHKSYIVNTLHVKSVNKQTGKIKLSNGTEIAVSKRNLSLF